MDSAAGSGVGASPSCSTPVTCGGAAEHLRGGAVASPETRVPGPLVPAGGRAGRRPSQGRTAPPTDSSNAGRYSRAARRQARSCRHGHGQGATFPIHARMYDAIESSDIIVCDLTGKRPNVCVEAGYALSRHDKGRLVFLFEPSTNMTMCRLTLRRSSMCPSAKPPRSRAGSVAKSRRYWRLRAARSRVSGSLGPVTERPARPFPTVGRKVTGGALRKGVLGSNDMRRRHVCRQRMDHYARGPKKQVRGCP